MLRKPLASTLNARSPKRCRQLWVGSATSPHAKPVFHTGLGAIHLRVPGLGSEAVACMVEH